MKLTARQQEIYQFICDHQKQTGYPPTRQEISAHFGFRSPNAAEQHLRAIAKKGAIELLPGASRGIRLPDTVLLEQQAANGLPIVGRVAAGEPILATEHIEDTLAVDQQLFAPQADYLLRVHGDSMIDIGIFDGDLLAVHKCQTAENGQIVVARLDDEVTVKRFQQDGQHVQLIAENENYPPIQVDLAERPLAIEGRAVGILRQQL